jgi:hypothetical protein
LDVEKCINVAKAFVKSNSGSEIKIKHQRSNLGNKKSFQAATAWAFSSESQLIILEDDIRVSADFFSFMDWALAKFKSDKRVFQINGLSVIDKIPGRNRLFESMNCCPWGWGIWKDRWLMIDFQNDSSHLEKYLGYPILRQIKVSQEFIEKWSDRFERLGKGLDTYDYGLNATAWSRNMVAISPRFTFTTNVGFGEESLHTRHRPQFLRNENDLRSRSCAYRKRNVVKFPSYYDAYSDFIQWKHPGANVGSARLILYLYRFFKTFKRSFTH